MPLIPGADFGGVQPSGPPEAAGNGGNIKQQILQMLRQAIAEDPDEEDKLAMEKCTTIIQQLLARDQQDSQQALGNAPLQRALRRV